MNLRKRKSCPSISATTTTTLSSNTSLSSSTSSAKKAKRSKSSANSVPSPPNNIDNNFNIESYLTEPEWLDTSLKDEFTKDYFKQINTFLSRAYQHDLARPPKNLVFNAFNSTKLSQIKVIILGQDPYHDDDQADGLAFSISKADIKLPRTLENIFTELKNDIPEFERSETQPGCLQKWANDGVFLLNSFLTVEAHKAASHSRIGWNTFTDKVIEIVSETNKNCVFILWGGYAHKKETLIDGSKHKIIKCCHPSPLSQKNFFNSKCFSQANEYLKSMGRNPVNWSLK